MTKYCHFFTFERSITCNNGRKLKVQNKFNRFKRHITRKGVNARKPQYLTPISEGQN